MKQASFWSRRHLLYAAVGLASLTRPVQAQEAEVRDRGLGGTGVVPTDHDTSDRGIGGTGVIGTIRRFGSIVVNDLRITFPRSVQVRIDDRPARRHDLAIGHVVHILAQHQGTGLATRLIEVFSEVVGPVQARTPGRIVVLGQSVALPNSGRRHREWRVGQWVAVSGLRRLDGTIVASRVETRPAGVARLAGVPRADTEGVVRIGALQIDGLGPEEIDQRLHLVGQLSADRFVVRQTRPGWRDLLAKAPDMLSIEDYVALDNGALQLGSGLAVSGNETLATAGEGRAVVSATVADDGHVQVSAIRAEGGSVRSGVRGSPGRLGAIRGAPGGPHGQPISGSPGPGGFGAPNGRGPRGSGGFGGPGGSRGSGPGGIR